MNRVGTAGKISLAVAVAVWIGVVVGGRGRLSGVAVALLVAGLGYGLARRPPALFLGVGLIAGSVSGVVAVHQQEAVQTAQLPDTRVELLVRTASDPLPARHGWVQVVVPEHIAVGRVWQGWSGPPLALATTEPLPAPLGSRVHLAGRVRERASFVRGDPIAGWIRGPTIRSVSPPTSGLVGVAQLIRERVTGNLAPAGPGGALLSGFLIGDTSRIDPLDVEALRRSGLSHYVAVSGSNVALFLGLWWLLLWPLDRFPRTRAASGVLGLALFVVITRAEPSVVRASAMTGVLLIGRVAGWAFDRWTALGLGVAGCLLVSGDLAFDVGFQLSVAATAGVMAGSRMVRVGPRPVRSVLGASIAAQVAVAPIVLVVFGSLPLASPVANLVAAPLVGLATMVGGIGALSGVDVLVRIAALVAEAVIGVGRVAARWPQLDAVQFSVLAVPLLGAAVLRPLRKPLLGVAAVVVVILAAPFGRAAERPAVVFLDVGQGDAALVLGSGFTALIDGGPDPLVLSARLARYGVDRVDLLVVSHVHADHVEGLEAVVGRMPVGQAWLAFEAESTEASDWLVSALSAAAVPVRTPAPGSRFVASDIVIEVVGPVRRYASPNDQSIVLDLEIAGRRFLFPGDVEVVAQAELGDSPTDVLKVPHQGAATSDPGWLEATHPALAVISVGPNDFGHPAPWVIETLESAGATVVRTDVHGDVVVEPDGLALAPPWWRLAR